MAKKQNKTFAQRAKSIVKKYKRADFDPIEKAALDSSLQKLQQEQEAYKQSQGINTVTPEQTGGDNVFAGDKGGSYLPTETFNRFQTPMDATKLDASLPTTLSGNDPYEFGSNESPYSFGKESPYSFTQQAAPTPVATTDASNNASYSPYKTSIAPSLIGGVAEIAGNMYLANQQKGGDDLKLDRISTPNISLERGRQAASREATRAKQRTKYAAKQGARTRGELMANRVAGEATISGKLGETLSASHEKEALVNANMQAGMNAKNAEIAAKEKIINNAQKIKNKAEREAYLAAAMGTIPQVMKDIGQTRRDDMYISSLGDDYNWMTGTDPDAKWYQKKKKPVKVFTNKKTGKQTTR